jgi:tripartite-type tricarboxylate transporter receptor subunit TctC
MFKPIVALAFFASVVGAHAQSGAAPFPSHPIRVIVAMPAGGGVDTATRMLTGQMQSELGQALPVENKPGAGGTVAAEDVFHSAADGYTLLSSPPAAITTNNFLYKSLNYDATQFKPVAMMSKIPNVLLVREGLPFKNVQELITYAKANPGKLTYASQGIGTTSHLTAELFQTLTHTKLVHVPYRGTAPALNDLLAGNVDMMFNELATSLQYHQTGKARILAVLTKERVASVPDVPTMEQAGVSGCESDTWNSLSAPPGTPDAVITKLNEAAAAALRNPVLLDHYAKLSMTPGSGTPAELAEFIKQETIRWGAVIKTAGIQPE